MKAYKVSIDLLLDPTQVGPEADEWNTPANVADYFSNLLSGNESGTILDWRYSEHPCVSVVEIPYPEYEEGDMDNARVISRLEP